MMPEPVFLEAWEAQAFAMMMVLKERGYLTAKEWTEALSNKIAAAQGRGEPSDGTGYYHAWLAALEKAVVVKGLMTTAELARRKVEWNEAAGATPHGQPIELRR